MKINSCSCFEEIGAEIEPTGRDTFNMIIKRNMDLPDGTTVGYVNDVIEDIKYCPFCGKKIEVK